jgi:hypothetical protein
VEDELSTPAQRALRRLQAALPPDVVARLTAAGLYPLIP